MTESILAVLARGQVVVGDGAFGTMLQAQGLGPGTIPEAWNADHPDRIQAVHRAYLEAGSQIITANTFGGNRPRLSDAGLEDRLIELNKLGVQLAREVAGSRAWVGASVGPTGKLMAPLGELSVEQIEKIYAEQIRVVAEAGVDIIMMETHHEIEEACAAVRMAKSLTDLPVFCTFAFDARGRTMMGLRPEDAARRALEAGADVVGANCGEGPQAVLAALQGMHAVTQQPLMAQANAGIPQADASGEAHWDVTPEQMATHVQEFISLGALVVGGCCGTTPAHITAIAAMLRE